MLAPLLNVALEKAQRYTKAPTGFEHLTLLIYYDMAVLHNSPPETPWFGFEDAAKRLSSVLRGDGGVFDKVLLFVAVTPGRRCLPVFDRSGG